VKRTLDTGTFIGEYRIERVLGQGGFGITYLAWDEDLARWVAIKEYFPRGFAHRDAGRTVTPNPDDQDRADFDWGMRHFVEEAKSLTRFRHRNIVGAIRFLRENGTAYLVMEYCDGESLEDRVKRDGALSSQELKPILDQLLDGLEEVHRANLLHLDLKPSNIFVKKDGTVVLLDFGSARQAISSHTKSVKVASAGYAALEQESADVEAGKLGAWTDIYGLGATLYRLMTGTRPQQATARVLQDGLVPLSDQPAVAHDPGLKKAVDEALNVKPQDRPASVDVFRRAIAEVPGSVAEDATRPEIVSAALQEIPKSTSGIPPIFFVAILIIILIPIVVTMTGKDNPSESTQSVDGVSVDLTPHQPDNDLRNSQSVPSDGGCTGSNLWNDCIGTRMLTDGSNYSGAWKANYPHGWGRWSGAGEFKGHSYAGNFKNGIRSGEGIYSWANGDRYDGRWENGKTNGYGTLTLATGVVYSGIWTDDKSEPGIFTVNYPNKEKYIGTLNDGEPSGRGTYTWPDGSLYTGSFRNGVQNGFGIQQDAAGSIQYQGLWSDGRPQSPTATENRAASTNQRALSLLNYTGVAIYRVYVRKSATTEWGIDILGDAVILKDDSHPIFLELVENTEIDILICDELNYEYLLSNINPVTAQVIFSSSTKTGSGCRL
jgi:serine/threonine protein kinase